MAEKWSGNINVGGSTYVRVGFIYSYTPTTITSATTRVTVSWTFRVRMITTGGYAFGNDSWAVSGGDTASGTASWSLNGAGTHYNLASGTKNVNLIYGSTQSFNLNGVLYDVAATTNDGSVSVNLTIPARPLSTPAAPSSFSVSRVSDTQQNVSWTRNPTTAAPYTNMEVWRRSVDGGSYTRVATLSGTATSWSDTSTSANRRYTYRVRATNSAGSSPYSNTDAISTTPATPGAPIATKLSNGDIWVTRPTLSSVAAQWQVREVGGSILATLGDSVLRWTHTAPNPLVTHTYQIRAVSSDPTLYSGWSAASNTVQLITAPAAPTNLSPNGDVLDMTNPTVLSWNHNPLDSSEQTAYQIRRRRAGGGWTTQSKTTSTAETETWPANRYTNGGANVEWQVRTWGAATTGGSDGSGASPWSATAVIQPFAQPVAGTVDPDGSAPVTLPSYLFKWSFFQAQGLNQSQWEVELYDSTSPSLILASGSGSGTGATWQSPPALRNGGSYSWRVRVRDSYGVWSEWTPLESFTVVFEPPNPPDVLAEWNRDGYVLLNLSAVNDGIAPDTVSLTIERSIDGGNWVLLANNLRPSTEYLDWTATVAGENCYRITAVSVAGATSTIEECVTVTAGDCSGDVYIGGGADLGMVVRFVMSDTVGITTGRQRVLNQFDGRLDPVESSSMSIPYGVSVTAKIPPSSLCGDLGVSDPRLIERVFHLPGPHLYRDWTGRHMFVSLSDLQYVDRYLGDVFFSVVRADGGTEAQRSAIGAYVGPYLVESPDGEYRITGGTMVEVTPGEWVWTP